MMKQIPTVQKYMTTVPQVIQSGASLTEAHKVMEEMGFRHLPVLQESKLVGILSDRDIKLAMSFPALDPEKLLVYDICVHNPYTVSPHSGLDEVTKEMAEKHIGSAIVVDNDEVVGIFTTVDVCRALSEILQQRFHQ